jgi:alkylation response protein AidB-like acyl-CoA dehydrogenase
MDYEYSPELQQLRVRVRQLIQSNFGDGFPTIFADDPAALAASHAFCETLGLERLMTISWPADYGGEDADLWSQLILAEEMWSHNEPRGGQYYGPNWVGPTIMKFGTDAQKAAFLPEIAQGNGRWAQGYSEPEAGSDLASLRLRGDRCPGGWRLNGQKIWTSYASFAHWIILLARTEAAPDKHDGITAFTLPMDRDGIEVRPIDSIAGINDFNEVFFNEVFVSESEVLGEVGRGWDVARASLAFERVGNPRWARMDRLLWEYRETVEERGGLDPVAAAEWVKAALGCRVSKLVQYRVVDDAEHGADPAANLLKASVYRALTTVNDQNVMDTLMGLAGQEAALAHGETDSLSGGEIEHEWRLSRSATIAAGTIDVQRMIIGRRFIADGG